MNTRVHVFVTSLYNNNNPGIDKFYISVFVMPVITKYI